MSYTCVRKENKCINRNPLHPFYQPLVCVVLYPPVRNRCCGGAVKFKLPLPPLEPGATDTFYCCPVQSFVDLWSWLRPSAERTSTVFLQYLKSVSPSLLLLKTWSQTKKKIYPSSTSSPFFFPLQSQIPIFQCFSHIFLQCENNAKPNINHLRIFLYTEVANNNLLSWFNSTLHYKNL